MKIKIEIEDLQKCFEFATQYYLTPKKSKTSRTTGQYRGFGGILSDFMLGKTIELGVAKGIDQYTKEKKCNLDFEIHSLGKDKAEEPDITSITEDGKERAPNVYTEIKNTSDNDRWLGLTQEQLGTMLESKICSKSGNNVYLIYANLSTKDDKDADLLGVYLKAITGDKKLNGFSDIDNLFVEIKHILTAQELIKYGTQFNKGSNFYETNIVGGPYEDKDAEWKRNRDYKKLNLKDCPFPVITHKKSDPSKEIGDFALHGHIHLYIKYNEKSRRVFLDAITDSRIDNVVLGSFKFEKGKMYDILFDTVGRDPILKRNNIWVAKRNIDNIINKDVSNSLKSIAKLI